jgi:hypothetical protein
MTSRARAHVIPSEVDGSRGESLKVTHRDWRAWARRLRRLRGSFYSAALAQNDTFAPP